MKVVVDAKAWTDLNQIGAWIAKDDPRSARKVLRQILDAIAQLERFPRLAQAGRVDGTRGPGESATNLKSGIETALSRSAELQIRL